MSTRTHKFGRQAQADFGDDENTEEGSESCTNYNDTDETESESDDDEDDDDEETDESSEDEN